MSTHSFIVADAGGTSTDWRMVSGDDIKSFTTVGYNAYTHSIADLEADLQNQTLLTQAVTSDLYFYAAGIETTIQKKELRKALSNEFKGSIYVYNDLLGVARALCKKQQGHVGILGTGANACYYDGEEVNKVSASLGYILGDEGSGADIGKRLLKHIFRGQISSEIVDAFQEQYQLTSSEAIEKIYNEPKPNHYLASFTGFVHAHRFHVDIHRLISESFTDFFHAFYPKGSPPTPIHFVGSIAWYFAEILKEVIANLGAEVGTLAQSPIAGLVQYHQAYG